MLIRPLDPAADRARLERFFAASAEYIRLERDADPGPEVIEEFLTDAPPGCDPEASLRLGLFVADTLSGIAELSFGFPEPRDAYLGLMMVVPDQRGKGTGAAFLRHLETAALARGADRMLLAVLDANPRGRAFWEREGFALALANREVQLGQKVQIAHRLAKPLRPPGP